jgi:hypothetical protein
MKIQKVKGLDVKPPKKSAFTIDTPEHLFKMNQLVLCCGVRGSGKTTALINLIRMYMDHDIIQRVILISPTYFSNKELFEPLNIDEENDIYEAEKESLDKVVENISKEVDEYNDYLEKKKKYKSFQKTINSDTPINMIDPNLIIMYQEMGFLNNEKPVWKYKNDKHPPRVYIVVDDAIGSDVYSTKSKLVHLSMKHRHINNGIGVSIAMLLQTYSATGNNSCPRCIRENATMIMLFKNSQDAQIKKIYDEVGDSDLSEEQFIKMFHYATQEPHSFLCIDKAPKDKTKKYRKNFNEYLIF